MIESILLYLDSMTKEELIRFFWDVIENDSSDEKYFLCKKDINEIKAVSYNDGVIAFNVIYLDDIHYYHIYTYKPEEINKYIRIIKLKNIIS